MRRFSRKVGRVTVRTYPYNDGRAQQFYVWSRGWTLSVAVVRTDRGR